MILGETQRQRWDALGGQSAGAQGPGAKSSAAQSPGGQSPREQSSGEQSAHEQSARDDGQRRDDPERTRFLRSRALVQSAVAEFLGGSDLRFVVDARCPSCGGPHGPLTLALREGAETDAEPDRLGARTPSSGRASLALRPSASVPSVSLSTSEDVIVVAVSDDARFGVDIEVLFSARHGVGSGDVLQRVRDVAAVLGVDTGDEREVLQRWVRVEAVLKADGRGLRVDPLDVYFVEDGAGADADADADDYRRNDADDRDRNHDDHDVSVDPTTGSPRWRAIVRDDADVVYRGTDLALAPGLVGAVARVAELG